MTTAERISNLRPGQRVRLTGQWQGDPIEGTVEELAPHAVRVRVRGSVVSVSRSHGYIGRVAVLDR